MTHVTVTEAAPNKEFYRRLLIVCWIFYMFSMAVKNIYNAQIIQIIQDFGTTKASASLASSFYFVTYAATQFLLAKVLPKLRMRNYLLVTMGLSGFANVLVVFCTEVWQIWAVFAVTGFLQAGLWPCCILAVSQYLPISMHTGANTLLSTGFAGGMGLAYCLSALFLHLGSWRATFWVSNIAMLLLLVAFYYLLSKADKYVTDHPENPIAHAKSPEEKPILHSKKVIVTFFALVIVPDFFTHVAFYGVYNWVPSLLFDVYHLPTSLSTLLTVTLPICAIAGPLVANRLCTRYDYWKVSFGMTLLSCAAVLSLVFFFDVNMWLALALTILFIVSVRGVSNIESAVIPLKNRDLLNAGSSAAILNAIASIGAAVSPPMMGKIMDASPEGGRRITYFIILAASVIVLIFSQLGYRFTHKTLTKQNEKESEQHECEDRLV